MRFEGKRVLVTGGGTGIGAAVATRMIQEGAVVTVMGRRQAPLESISPHFVVGDVSKTDDCRRAVEMAGPLDVLVHNAGVAGTGWGGAGAGQPAAGPPPWGVGGGGPGAGGGAGGSGAAPPRPGPPGGA